MQWQSDTSTGEWIRERLAPFGSGATSVVPGGYEAYARVLHEPEMSPAAGEVSEISSWRAVAEAFGTTLHPLAQWRHIVRTPPGEDWYQRVTPDGRDVTAPIEGDAGPELLALLMQHAVGASLGSTPATTPGTAAIWEGWGGLLGSTESVGRAFMSFGTDGVDPETAARHAQMLQASTHDPFNSPYGRTEWHDGILSREISEGPRLELPNREYVLFRGNLTVLADSEWFLRVPWRDTVAEQHGFDPAAQSPNLIWPDDHSWAIASEVDFDSTLVGGPRALIDAIVADERLEAFEIAPDADLTWDGDAVNA